MEHSSNKSLIDAVIWEIINKRLQVLAGSFTHKISRSPKGPGTPTWFTVYLDPSKVRAKWHLNLSNGLSTKMTDDKQTDRQITLQKNLRAIGGITCTTRAVSDSFNNTIYQRQQQFPDHQNSSRSGYQFHHWQRLERTLHRRQKRTPSWR